MSNATLDDILKELREIKELLKKIANDTYRIPWMTELEELSELLKKRNTLDLQISKIILKFV